MQPFRGLYDFIDPENFLLIASQEIHLSRALIFMGNLSRLSNYAPYLINAIHLVILMSMSNLATPLY